MSDLRPVLHVLGLLVSALALAMLVPAAADAAADNPDWQVFLAAAAFTLFFGGALVLATYGGPVRLGVRQAFLLTTLAWVTVAGFAALPFAFSSLALDYADAFFEAMSGITTTGSTVLTGLDSMPPGILLWRALLQWIGGIGIIAMAIAVLPLLRVGGMQLFRMESSETSEKVLPRPQQIAAYIGAIYVGLTALCAAAYAGLGMSAFEAVAHAMTTVSTGGYSTSDGSLGHFPQPALHWAAVLFMLAGSLPFFLYVRAARGAPGHLLRDSQVRTFLVFAGVAALALALWVWHAEGRPFAEALRLAAFNVVSIVTTTGYATADYMAWGTGAVVAFFLFIFVGGCTGSTAGGLKTFRFQVMFLAMHRQIWHLTSPSAVVPMTYNGRELPEDIPPSVMAFAGVFVVTAAALTLMLAAFGFDFLTAASAAATAIANVGPGLGPVVGPAGSFATLPDGAKWVLAFGMLLGRLEIFTVLVVLTPRFWRG